MAASLTQDIGAFVAGLTFDAIPAEAAEVVETGTIDGVGVMIPGRAEANVGIVERRFRTRDEAPESRLFMTDERVSAPLAALVNGVAMHVLDYDDVALPLGGHPSTVLVPALLAEADAVPGTTGKDLVRAYVAGYEVWAEVAGRDADAHHLKGWHPTSALGVLGAAAACAVLRGLDADKAAHAIGIAASSPR
ncbi:MAG: MmgE/PrpD family protein, partial [Alphaproteobacteria bacterium]|nr:MmgE/PrpD family protein [Alphaproteobacteria bacterium]